MDHVVMPLFSIPLYVSNIKITDEFRQLAESMEYRRLNIDNGDLSTNTRVLDDSNFENIKVEIQKHIDHYVKDILKVADYINFNIQNSWLMRHKKGDFSNSHIHANSLLSGILYIDVSPDSGNLVFHKEYNYPNLFPPAINVPVKERNIFNSKTWTFTPGVGQIFIFPSSLSHSVDVCMSDKLRYCLAFNLFPSGTLGLEDGEPLSILRI